MSRFSFCVAAVVSLFIASVSSRSHADDLWPLEKLTSPPAMKWLDDSSPIRSLTYENEKFKGQTTDVFAFYATPGTISGDTSKDKNLPAVVLIHGGGGTAFAQWTWLWAKRGYAAIAMDLSGRRPPAPKFDPATGELISGFSRSGDRTRLEYGGPEHGHVEKFSNVGDDPTDDWQHHSVPAVIRAHSLIRSFKEVDAERTAVTGISWGGYMTCLVASVDHRFKAAVPVYGCGFLYDGESVQRPAIDKLSPEKRSLWIKTYDPSAWLPKCRVPILFVNGTNDIHYPLVSYSRSYGLVKGPKQIRIEVKMRHGHQPGWAPNEIGRFIDHHLLGTEPLPQLGKPQISDGKATVGVEASLELKKAQLHYTTDDGRLADRNWTSVPATLDGKTISATVPDTATIWLLSVTDTRDAMVSTDVVFSN
ncbi:MAG: alpha/beta hydrolase family protein [Planctomycetales bacterium]|jgi:dienelactone hydrolase